MKLTSKSNTLNNTYNFITQQRLNHKFEPEQQTMENKAAEILQILTFATRVTPRDTND